LKDVSYEKNCDLLQNKLKIQIKYRGEKKKKKKKKKNKLKKKKLLYYFIYKK